VARTVAPAVFDHVFDRAAAGSAVVSGATRPRDGLDRRRALLDGRHDLLLGNRSANADEHPWPSELKIMNFVISVQGEGPLLRANVANQSESDGIYRD
jgi:hypothetical protein